MKLIRWGGLVAFIIIAGGMVIFWYFFADNIIKNAIEDSGSDAAGAEISIDTLDISLQPLGIELKTFQLASASNPARNATEFDRAVAHLDFLKLLQGQVIINSLAVEGLRFDTQRAKPSTWKKKEEPPQEPEGDSLFAMPDIQLNLPELDEVMAKEDLLTTKMSAQIQLHYDEESKKLEVAIAHLPDEEKFRNYEARIKAATSGKVTSVDDFKKRKADLEQVQTELRADNQALKDARQQMQTSRDLLQADIKALKAAPGQDMDNLKNKYKLDETGAANVSGMLFGAQAGEWTRQTLYWYDKIKPLLASEEEAGKPKRATGRYVHFHSDHPLPDFLIRDTHIDVELSFGHLSAKLKNITHQMHITGVPATLAVRGEKLHGMKSFAVDGVFDHIRPGHGKDSLSFKLDDMKLKDVSLVKNEKLPITLAQANIDITGKAVLTDNLIISTDAQFNPVRFVSRGDSTLGKMFAEAFTGIERFSLGGEARSDFRDIDMDFKSDLDEQVKASLKRQWDVRVAAFQQKIRDRLDAEEQKVRNRIEGELAKLEQKKADLESRLKQSEELLKAKVADFKEQQKQQLEQKKDQQIDKLKDSLKNKLKR
ncbi:MAG: hypothetical protein QG652_249 [Pseudomonadota bacterium]|nr:hypothetical protein [Pseudomonadota bacterium]